MKNYIRNQIAKKGRIGYLLSRTFPTFRSMMLLYPVLERMPFLLPLCWVLRLAEAVIRKPRKVIYQLTAAFKYRSRRQKEESKENIGFVAGDSKGGQRPLWHTTFRGKSSVLYLYEADRIRKWRVPV